jgi:hypothetical protein
MILRDYSCMAHGIFESAKPECPQGCKGGMVSIVHLKAPGFVSVRTKGIDKTTRNLASQFGLTDMDNRGGQPVKRPDPMAEERNQKYQEWLKEKFGSTWQAVAPGGVQHADGTITGGSGGGGATQTIVGMGATGGSAVKRDEIGHTSVPFDSFEVPLATVSSAKKHEMLAEHVVVAEHKADV